MTGRKVERPWLGAKLEAVTRDIAEALGLERVTGAVVARVQAASPAAQAGLKTGDVIVAVDGVEAADPRTVLYRLTTRGVGNRVRFEVLRQGRRTMLDVVLKGAPAPGRDDVRNLSGAHPFDGARVSNLLPGVADELGIDGDDGVAILSVRAGSVAAKLGFQPGDIIMQIGTEAVDTLLTLERLVAERQRLWQVAVKRAGRVLTLQVPG